MTLITDRTDADVLMQNAKGMYGPTDLNRVESTVCEISLLLGQLDINLRLQTKTDWDYPEMFSAESWPVQSQMRRYIDNVTAIRDATSGTVQLPDNMDNLTADAANSIEQVLLDAYDFACKTIKTYRYSGEFYAGEEN